jgi:hypothetical protein
METAGRNVLGINTEGEKEGSGAVVEHRGDDASGGDRRGVVGRKKGKIERCSTGGMVLPKMKDTMD